MVTPFADDTSLDLDAAASVARALVATGSEGLVVAGTTGEGPVLSDPERLDLFRAVVDAVDVPVIVSTGTNDTAHSVMLTKEAKAMGADGVLAVTPYYNRPSMEGLALHFGAIADASDLPVMLYDIPVRSGRRIGPELIVALAERHANVVAVKDAAGDVADAARVVAEAPPGFEVYSGDDALLLPLVAVGAVGVVSVASHWAAGLFAALIEATAAGDLARARALATRLRPSCAFEASDIYPNPVPAKAMMRVLGHAVGQCRLPHGPGTEQLEQDARAILAELALPV